MYCVGSTDDGLVRLFNYPVVIEKAPHHAFRGLSLSLSLSLCCLRLRLRLRLCNSLSLCAGHSSHVQNVRFLADDTRVVSAGGRDGSMMQWTTHGITKPSKNAVLKRTVRESQRKTAPKKAAQIQRRGQPAAAAELGAVPVKKTMEELQKAESLNRAMLKEKDKEIQKLRKRLTRDRGKLPATKE